MSRTASGAYLANGRVLRILDISDPSDPVSLGSIHLRGVNDVKVRDGYAFVTGRQPYGFCVVDVSDPAAPDLVWATGGGTRQQVELYSDYAYVRGSSISVYDISDPLNVEPEGGFAPDTESFTIDGDRLVVGGPLVSGHPGVGLLRIFDLAADPVDPLTVVSWTGESENLPGHLDAKAIAVKDDHVYLAGADHPDHMLLTIDVSDPANPALVSTIEEFNFLLHARLAVEGDRLYLVERREWANQLSWVQGLIIYDIGKNPSAPALITSHQTHGGVAGVLPIGETLYLWDRGEGFLIMDATDPLNLQRIGNYHSPADLREMAKSGDYLYVADGWGGLTILNVADGMAPVVESVYLPSTEPDGYVDAYGVAERDGLVYLTLRRRLEVIDVSDPVTPLLVGSFHLDQVPQFPDPWDENWIRGITLSGNTAFLGYSAKFCGGGPGCVLYSRLLELTVSNPADITLSSLTPVDYNSNTYPKDAIHAIEPVVGDPLSLPHHHYLVGPDLIIVEDDGREAVQIHSEWTAAEDLAVNDGLAFVAMSGGGPNDPPETRGLRIEDISDPANPVTLSITNSAFGSSNVRAYAVDAQNGRAYVSSNVSGGSLHVLDVTDPTKPAVLDTVGVLGLHGEMLADEPHLYLTHTSHGGWGVGFAIVHVHGTEPPDPGDLNADGVVNVVDLLLLLGDWGACEVPQPSGQCAGNCVLGGGPDCFCDELCFDFFDCCSDVCDGCPDHNFCPPLTSPPCPGDLDGDGSVGVADLLMLLANWG